MEKEDKILDSDSKPHNSSYKIGLAVYYDGNEINSVYINNLNERFSKYFETVFVVFEDENEHINP
jgi:hypothetical protein